MTGRRTILGFTSSVAAAAAITLSMAGATQAAPTTMTLKGFDAPGTPAKLSLIHI